MQHIPELIGIATAVTIGAVSPGPSFVMVARTAASVGRLNGLLAALGMGLGGLCFSIASLLGLHGVLLAVPSLRILAGGRIDRIQDHHRIPGVCDRSGLVHAGRAAALLGRTAEYLSALEGLG